MLGESRRLGNGFQLCIQDGHSNQVFPIAESPDDFLKWFESPNARALAERLRNEYEVNGQTAWALLTKAERYRICLVSELPDEQVKLMRMTPARSLAEALAGSSNQTGFIMPRGAAVLPRIENTK